MYVIEQRLVEGGANVVDAYGNGSVIVAQNGMLHRALHENLLYDSRYVKGEIRCFPAD